MCKVRMVCKISMTTSHGGITRKSERKRGSSICDTIYNTFQVYGTSKDEELIFNILGLHAAWFQVRVLYYFCFLMLGVPTSLALTVEQLLRQIILRAPFTHCINYCLASTRSQKQSHQNK